MHKLRGNYNSCTGMCSEDICSSSAGAQKKGKRGSKTGWNSVYHKKWIYAAAVPSLRKKERGYQNRMKLSLPQKMVHFWVSPAPWRLMYSFAGFLLNLTRFRTKLRFLVLCFHHFSENSIVLRKLAAVVLSAASSLSYKEIWVLHEWLYVDRFISVQNDMPINCCGGVYCLDISYRLE